MESHIVLSFGQAGVAAEGVSIARSTSVSGSAGAASRALVMELVEGDDLSAHMARGPIPVAEALPIARQIAEALEAAHEQGSIQRDLKPANIKVRTDGAGKVLGFGLAKAMDPSGLRQAQPPGGTDAELVEASATITYYRPAGGFAGDLRMVEVTLR